MLMLPELKPGETEAQSLGRVIVPGLAANAFIAHAWSAPPLDRDADLTAVFRDLEAAAERVNQGDLSQGEALLTAQAVTLNAVFTTLAFRAKNAELMDHFERYLRLAFKAQSQCRSTLETLAVLKNPPVFTRQANIAGQQVVNNGTMVARAREIESAPKELQEAHGERVDGRAPGQAISADPPLETVGALHRTKDRRG